VCTLLALQPAVGADSGPPLGRLLRFDAVTQTAWGERYEHGEGVTRDYDRAVQLYCAAARRGHATAQYKLGWMYANGRGVPRDDTLAAAWFQLAAERGDPHAQRVLPLVGGKASVAPRCVGTRRQAVEPFLPGRIDLNSPQRKAVVQAVQRLAERYALDPHLVIAVIQTESAFDPQAVSPKGAMGLMQLMPGTADRFGVRDPFDPEQNIRGGMAYLRWLLTYFNGNVVHAVAAYNAGEEAVTRHGGIPPYPETQTYVQRVTAFYPNPVHPVAEGAKRGRPPREGNS
jgi:hypothetical protein